ncbi:High mobility group protein B3 [Tupaia chinensis]|uniref:High mobility group protein B3 n=1 Tax=Tupaia chinensis TaxID=246437 RepID=L9LAR9_TUPCH|nr:High mobility group protein B3 [Tupaia chinensis]
MSCPALPRLADNPVRVAKGDPKNPKGTLSAYAFFVQTCREEHKEKNRGPCHCGDSEKQPPITKAATLKEDQEDAADHESTGKRGGAQGPAKIAREKVEEDDEKDEEEEEEEE